MTVEEFLEIHPDEDVDLQVPEGRVLLDHGQVQRLLGGRPVIVCKTGVQDAQYMQAEDLPVSYTHLGHQRRFCRGGDTGDLRLQQRVHGIFVHRLHGSDK